MIRYFTIILFLPLICLSCTNTAKPVMDDTIVADAGIKSSISSEPIETIKKLQRECDANDSSACTNLGLIYRRGIETPKNELAAFRLYQKACNLNNARACSNLGVMYASGYAVRQNAKQGARLESLSILTPRFLNPFSSKYRALL